MRQRSSTGPSIKACSRSLSTAFGVLRSFLQRGRPAPADLERVGPEEELVADLPHRHRLVRQRPPVIAKHRQRDLGRSMLGNPGLDCLLTQRVGPLARHRLHRGQKHARNAYEACIGEAPLSYYALMAWTRLRAGYRPLYNKLRDKILTPIDPNRNVVIVSRGRWRKDIHIQRAIELSRLGFSDFALREIEASSRRVSKRERREARWLVTLTLANAGTRFVYVLPSGQVRLTRRAYDAESD